MNAKLMENPEMFHRASTRPAEIITGDRIVTQEAMSRRTAQVAGALKAMGIGEGAVVAQLMRNDTPIIEVNIAAQRLGCYSVPLNWHLTGPELLYVIHDCSADVLVVHSDLLPLVRDGLPAGCHVIAVETPPSIRAAYSLDAELCKVPQDVIEYESWLEAAAPHSGPTPPERGAIVYTSGTTGKPKGVKRNPMTSQEAEWNAEIFRNTYGIAPDMRGLVVTPLYHASPNGFARYAATRGRLLVLTPRFEAEEFLALIEKHRINVVTAVPTMFVKLLKLPREIREKYDTSSLRWISHTASACPVEVKKALIDWFGPIVHEVYGGTEVGITLHASPQEWLERPGTVGRCVPNSRIRILGDDGEQLSAGEPGEIYLRNANYADFTYINNPQARVEAERDGYISIGDVGYLDEDGFLFISDRKRDMIIFGGTNIYPAEIESELIQCPDVADCAVIGLPDPEFGEIVIAYVQPAPGAPRDANAIRDFLVPRLAKYKIPKVINFADTLPREESGKLMKRKLREMAASGRPG